MVQLNIYCFWKNSQNPVVSFEFNFEGIINELDRRYKETDSDYIKKANYKNFMVKKPVKFVTAPGQKILHFC